MFFYYLIDAFLCSVFSEVSIFDVSVEDYPIWHCLLGNAYFKEWFQGFWTYLYIYIFLQKNIYYYLFFDESQVLAWLSSTLSLMI